MECLSLSGMLEQTWARFHTVIVLACRWRYFAAEDLEGLKKLALNMDYRIVRIPCSGQVQENWIETALDSGAGAVMVIGGHLATCAYTQDANGREKEPNTEMGSSGIRLIPV